MNPIKAVIFDQGGVREIDTDEYTYHTLAKLLRRDYSEVKKISEKLREDFFTGRIDTREYFVLLTKDLGVEAEPNELMLTWKRCFIAKSDVIVGVDRIISRLKEDGYKVSILSNAEPFLAEVNMRRGRYEGFDSVILSYQVGLKKPDERIFKLAAEKLGLSAKECIFIDDRRMNVNASRRVGMAGIQFRDVRSLANEIRKHGVNL